MHTQPQHKALVLEKETPSSQEESEKERDPQTEEIQLEQIRYILHLMSKTVSQMKIFSPEHSTSKTLFEELWEKLSSYLSRYWKLELGIDEFSFNFNEISVFKDEKAIKSLPFLFYKDGMQTLFFYKDLKREELKAFLETIKRAYELPPEESDIVNLLWEKDFANIRYFAPDDFLETKITKGRELSEPKVDKKKLTQGELKLSPEDRNTLKLSEIANEISTIEENGGKDAPGATEIHPLDIHSTLSEEEANLLESMLTRSRRVRPEEELMTLILEILSSEERLLQFSETLEILMHTHQEILEKGEFYLAAELLSNLITLSNQIKAQDEERAKVLEKFLNNLKSSTSFDSLRELAVKGRIKNQGDFFEYLKLLGKETISLVGNLFEEIKSPDFRRMALNYLKEMGSKDLPLLVSLARDECPVLSREIISILSLMEGKKAIPHLSIFVSSKNKSIKEAAIEALGRIEDIRAERTLISFLEDDDEELRIKALRNLRFPKEGEILKRLIEIAKDKKFNKKNKEEKKELFLCMVKSADKQALAHLQNILKKVKFFSFGKKLETSLCAIEALKEVGSEDAIMLLKIGATSKKKRISQTCESAIREISLRQTPPFAQEKENES